VEPLKTFSANSVADILNAPLTEGKMIVAGREVRRVTPEEAQRWADRFNNGESLKKIAESEGRQPAVILKWVHKLGVTRSTRKVKPASQTPSTKVKTPKVKLPKVVAPVVPSAPGSTPTTPTATPPTGAAPQKPRNLSDLMKNM